MFRRFGVLKTRNITKDIEKILEKYKVGECLAELLAVNKAKAEGLWRLEALSKKALGKLSEDADDIEIKYSGYKGYEESQGKNILKELGFNENDNDELFLKMVCFALGYEKAQVVSAPKLRKDDINQLGTAAKNAKRQLKALLKEIYDCLEKLVKRQKQIQMVVDTIMSEKMAKGLWFNDYDKKLERLIKAYENLASKIIEIKNRIMNILKYHKFRDDIINKIYNDIKYPTYDIGKLRENKEKMASAT
ncbi:MAG: hypothetical protein Q4D57_00800 [Clostridia bacterium]|nr:hypothetical protein [Clostridia bacterium]